MPSPFPGMDPYLESTGGDMHTRLVMYICDQIEPQLPDGLYPQVEERMVMESSVEVSTNRYPDVRIMDGSQETPGSGSLQSSTATLSVPFIVQVAEPEVTERFVEVREIDGDRLVTVLEVLSPSNKLPGKDRRKYRRKRRELIRAGINLVEIDLLRKGKGVHKFSLNKLPAEYQTIYRVFVSRSSNSGVVEVHKVPLRDTLPSVAIPMRETDADVRLNLQSLVEQCYEKGRYRRLDYTADPVPPLEHDDAKWADELLRAKGLR